MQKIGFFHHCILYHRSIETQLQKKVHESSTGRLQFIEGGTCRTCKTRWKITRAILHCALHLTSQILPLSIS